MVLSHGIGLDNGIIDISDSKASSVLMDCAEFFAAKAARSTSYPLARFTVIELPQQAGMQPRASELPELPRFAFGALYAARSPRKSFDFIQPFCLEFLQVVSRHLRG